MLDELEPDRPRPAHDHDRAAGRANGIAAITPERAIREGAAMEQLLGVIDEDPDIAMLVLADDAVVFALANPVPEVDPLDASRHAAVVATGRSDFANQINNVLAFPGIFRGLLDAQSREITPQVLLAAATALAAVVGDDELNPTYIVPSVFHPEVTTAVADAVRKAVLAGGAETA